MRAGRLFCVITAFFVLDGIVTHPEGENVTTGLEYGLFGIRYRNMITENCKSKEIRNKNQVFLWSEIKKTYTMAVLKIQNDIQTEEQKKECQFWGDAEGVCFKDVDEFVASIPQDDNQIEVRLFCDGGVCSEGWAIYDKLRATGKEITCIVEGKAASMATIILMAAPKERRKAYKNAKILVHNPWAPRWALGDTLTAEDLEKAAQSLQQEQDRMLDLYVERCGCEREEMQALMDEDKFIDVERAKELGIIGEIIAPASAKARGAYVNAKIKSRMAKGKDEKVEVKKSLLDKVLAKIGVRNIDEVTVGLDLSTADGKTLTIEREEGEPQVGDKASPDGTFVMPDGKTIVVENGVITDILAGEGAEGADGGDGGDGGSDDKVAELTKKVEELEQEVEELKEKLDDANVKAKTVDDLRILNAVKIAGGEKALKKLSSSYKPQGRSNEGKNAHDKADGQLGKTPMEMEIEARRNGTWKGKNKKGEY